MAVLHCYNDTVIIPQPAVLEISMVNLGGHFWHTLYNVQSVEEIVNRNQS